MKGRILLKVKEMNKLGYKGKGKYTRRRKKKKQRKMW